MKDSISDLSTLTVKKPSKRKSIKIGNIYIYLPKKIRMVNTKVYFVTKSVSSFHDTSHIKLVLIEARLNLENVKKTLFMSRIKTESLKCAYTCDSWR